MTDREMLEKNLELSTEFSKYLLAHPDVEAQIPPEAQILFLVDNDPELTQKNREMAKQLSSQHQPVVFVHVKGLRQEVSRLIEPRLEKAS